MTLEFWLINNCERLKAALCKVPFQPYYSFSCSLMTSHILNVIIKCFMPPGFNQVRHARIILINEYVLCLLLPADSPMGVVLIKARDHLLCALFAALVQFVWSILNLNSSCGCHLTSTVTSLATHRNCWVLKEAALRYSWLWKQFCANSTAHQI